MAFNWKKWTRKTHYWAAIVVALPLLVIILSGLLLQVKKQVSWIQPATRRSAEQQPSLPFDRLLDIAVAVPEAGVQSWSDIERLDVRPDRGVIKVQTRSSWELQIDHTTGEVLSSAYRRSDWIEDIHDGSLFGLKLWVFLPVGFGLLLLWGTGIYLFILPFWARRNGRRRAEGQPTAPQD